MFERQIREARERLYQDRQKREAAAGMAMEPKMSPYSEGAPGFDSTGRPIGPMPAAKSALAWQYEADRRTEQRRQALWGDAQNVMRQGTDLMQTYRPGGSAAMASGMYQNRGAMYGNQAMATESPDLLARWREKKAYDAETKAAQMAREAKSAANMATGLQIVGTVAGAATGGIAGAALAAGAGAGVALAARNAGGGASQNPSYGVGGTTPGQAPLRQVGVSGGGGGMPGGPSGAVGGGGGGGGAGARSGSGGGPGGRPMDKGGAAGLQGGAEAAGGGDGPMSMFSSQEAAYNAMMANGGNNSGIYKEWSNSPIRSQSTDARIMASMFRLQNSYYPS